MRSDFAIRLYNARRISGLSLDGLSEAMNHAVSKQCLSRYEMGVMKPRPKILLAISEALGITAGYFSGVSSNINYPMLRASVQCEMTDELLCQIESIILFHVERFRQKADKLNLACSFSCPVRHLLVSDIRGASAAADMLRNEWSCGDGAIPSMLRLLERRGILLFESDLPEGIMGLSTWVDEKYPLIILDTRTDKTTVERLRFTAAHELAHLFLSFPKDADVEKMCNRFASYFLLPLETMIQEIGSKRECLYLEELIDLHDYYGVSIAALVHEAYDFDIITREHYDYWYDNIIHANPTEAGWGKYLFPESLGKEKRMDIILSQLNVVGR